MLMHLATHTPPLYTLVWCILYLSVEPVATHESTGVTGVHVFIADHTRPLVRVLRRGVDRGRSLSHGRQWWAWFAL